MSCGIKYDPIVGSGADVYSWTLCADLAYENEGPFGEWPASGGGNRIVWDPEGNCQTSTISPDGVHAVAGAFYVYAYSPDLMRITPNNNIITGPELVFVDCGALPVPIDSIAEVGALAFGEGTGTNPCLASSGPRLRTSVSVLALAPVTLGDTVRVDIDLDNIGTDVLLIERLQPPSSQMRTEPPAPFSISAGGRETLTVYLEPRYVEEIAGSLVIESNDVTFPVNHLPVIGDILDLAVNPPEPLLPGALAPLGLPLSIAVTPAGGAQLDGGRVHYRPVSQTRELGGLPNDFKTTSFFPLRELFVGTIPGEGVTEGGIEYYVEFENSGIARTLPADAPQSVLQVPVSSPSFVGTLALDNSGKGVLMNQELIVEVRPPDGVVVRQQDPGSLYFRRGGESEYSEIPLEKPADVTRAVVPGSFVTARGLEYWARIQTATTTVMNGSATAPEHVQVVVTNLTESQSAPGDRYRMITIPVDFGRDFEGTLETLLRDQEAFLTYDDTRWRAFRYLPDLRKYVELPDSARIFQPVPGRAFWLTCRQSHRIDTAPVEGRSVPLNFPYTIGLEEGWNQIGCPFLFPVAWSAVSVNGVPTGEQTLVEPPRRYDPTARAYAAEDVHTLIPFEGYFVRAFQDVELLVPSEAAPDPAPASVVTGGGDERWALDIVAEGTGRRPGHGIAGVRPGASPEWDPFDRSAPPPAPDPSLLLVFVHDDWGDRSGIYEVDIRPPQVEAGRVAGWVWDFDAVPEGPFHDANPEAVLRVGMEGVPPGLHVVLLDAVLQREADLRSEPSYRFVPEPVDRRAGEKPRFRILVGNDEFLAETRESNGAGLRNQVYPNRPNPFRSSSVIRYEIDSPAHAQVVIYDLMGRIVKVLVDSHAEPGRYEVVWQGDDSLGRQVPTGIYFLRMTAPRITESRKIVRIR